jgi:toxin-antitoxin system PIN domain toxin
MMADNRCLVDTNVLIYSTVDSSPSHQEARDWLAALVDDDVELCIIPQIVREYLVVLTRGEVFEQQFTPKEALDELEAILPTFTLLDENEATVSSLRNLIRRYQVRGKSVHDANIVASMLTYGITRLVTYNTGDFRRYDEITIEAILTPDLEEEQ